jgi:hypothetical protein
MEFRELTDEGWSIISSFLPPKPKRGRRASIDERSLINGIHTSPPLAVDGVKCLKSMDPTQLRGGGLEDFKRLEYGAG